MSRSGFLHWAVSSVRTRAHGLPPFLPKPGPGCSLVTSGGLFYEDLGTSRVFCRTHPRLSTSPLPKMCADLASQCGRRGHRSGRPRGQAASAGSGPPRWVRRWSPPPQCKRERPPAASFPFATLVSGTKDALNKYRADK